MGTKRNRSNEPYIVPDRVTPDMDKTSPYYCSDCKYHSNDACNYFIATGHRRGCPVGWCNKYEKLQGKKKATKRILGGKICK